MKLITVDIGNTNIKLRLVVLKGNKIEQKITISTKKNNSSQYQNLIEKKIKEDLLPSNLKEVKDIFLISVVPQLNNLVSSVFWKLLQKKVIIFKPSMIGLKDDESCGHDLIALSVGAMKISSSSIVVSLGTATVFITIWKNEPQGVIIHPGLEISKKGLIANSSEIKKLNNYDFQTLLTKNEEEGAKIGLLLSHIGMIEEIITKIWKELGKKVPVLITGGNYRYLKKHLNNQWINEVPDLVTMGMVRIYKTYQSRIMSFLIKCTIFFFRAKSWIKTKLTISKK